VSRESWSDWAILKQEGFEPSPRRRKQSWSEFLRAQPASILECDFLTVDTLFLKRFYILFFIGLATRHVHLAGITRNPNGRWVTRQARNLLMQLDDEGIRPLVLVRDRDSKFTREFDEAFRSHGVQVIKAPVRAPTARAHAERLVGSIRRECLDRLLILGRSHLEHVVTAYVTHYKAHRPHRARAHRPPLDQQTGSDRPAARVIALDSLAVAIFSAVSSANTNSRPDNQPTRWRGRAGRAKVGCPSGLSRAPRPMLHFFTTPRIRANSCGSDVIIPTQDRATHTHPSADVEFPAPTRPCRSVTSLAVSASDQRGSGGGESPAFNYARRVAARPRDSSRRLSPARGRGDRAATRGRCGS
jgi:Integrase core domain